MRRRSATRRAAAAAVRVGAASAVVGTAHEVLNLRALRTPPPAPAPVGEPVSVLIPARDELAAVGTAVRCALAQTGVPDLEVVVLDDGSTDGTAERARRAAGGDPRCDVRAGTAPPPGWLGKPHACAQLSAVAAGSALVFCDADVVLEPGAVADAVSHLRRTRADLLSPWPRQRAVGITSRLVQPLQVWSWLSSLPLRRAERSSHPAMAVANGQFLVVDAAALAGAGGWATVHDRVLEDMGLARAVRRAGGRTAVADGSRIASCRMYDDWAELHAGYRKSLWTAFGSPVGAAAVAALLVLTYLVPPLAALNGSRSGLLGYGAAVAGRALAARRTGTPVWPDAVAHPASVAVWLALLASSWVGHRAGTLSWKGRTL